jgi:hypothetical protein
MYVEYVFCDPPRNRLFAGERYTLGCQLTFGVDPTSHKE